MSYPKDLRWWFEDWNPKHGRGCDCRACHRPLMSLLKAEFASPPDACKGITIQWLESFTSRTHAHRAIKLLEQHRFIHGCYAVGSHRQTVYMPGSVADCQHPEYH